MIDASQRDILRRFLFEPHPIRGEWVHLDATWQAVLERETYPHPIRDLLGQAVAAAALLTSTLKIDGRLTLQLIGGSVLKVLVVQCTSDLEIRAVARWEGDPRGQDFHGLVGDGQLSITIEKIDERKRYQGVVPVEGDSLTDSLQSYFRDSEQLPTRLWLAADDQQAVGMLLQRLPTNPDKMQSNIEDDAWPRVQALGDTVSQQDLLSWTDSDLLRKVFHEEDVRVFESEPVMFRCSCSRQRIATVLQTFAAEELRDMLEREHLEVRCEFCNKAFDFDSVDVERIITEKTHPHSSSSVH
ncbi:MAG: Hsp33 family molecular chaperone HslO [Gammaproteobacteria bacterium]|nr:Hsp33 family molecular chaperone HslO [Gammaproteobacteria bacterium]